MTEAGPAAGGAAPSVSVRVDDHPVSAGRDGNVVRVVTVDRPAALNAIDVSTMRQLAAAFEACGPAAAATPGVRAVLVTGAGDKAFVAGADIATLVGMSVEEAHAFSRLGHLVGDRIAALPVPVIAVVNGYALGGGCELALACDLVFASSAARFGQPEVKLGAIPGFGGTQRLMRRVGSARARALLFTGETIDAAEALRIGLCDRVFAPEQLLSGALEWASAVAARAPLAVAAIKRAIAAGADLPLPAALELESRLFADLFATSDLKAGMSAFIDKQRQPPKWRGR